MTAKNEYIKLHDISSHNANKYIKTTDNGNYYTMSVLRAENKYYPENGQGITYRKVTLVYNEEDQSNAAQFITQYRGDNLNCTGKYSSGSYTGVRQEVIAIYNQETSSKDDTILFSVAKNCKESLPLKQDSTSFLKCVLDDLTRSIHDEEAEQVSMLGKIQRDNIAIISSITYNEAHFEGGIKIVTLMPSSDLNQVIECDYINPKSLPLIPEIARQLSKDAKIGTKVGKNHEKYLAKALIKGDIAKAEVMTSNENIIKFLNITGETQLAGEFAAYLVNSTEALEA